MIDPEIRRTQLMADAYRIADDILWPAASDVDRTGAIPASHWAALADAGLYGIAAPSTAGGPGLSFDQILEIQEVLTSGCLSTAFVALQHHGVVIALAGSTNEALRDSLFDDVCAGRVRAGVAYAGVVPTPPRMRATRVEDGWVFDGHAPFVSGWGLVDILQISARDTDSDDVIAAIVSLDHPPDAITPRSLPLSAAEATRTVSLAVDGLHVPDAQVVSRVTYEQFFANQNVGIRINGTLPFGLVRRCSALLDLEGQQAAARALRERAGEVRTRLDSALADTDPLVDARADAARLAVSAAATLICADGGRSLLRGHHPERLAREAAFTLVAASRPQLKDVLVERFSRG